MQYKCAAVFAFYQSLAMNLKKNIIIYYGASGHGRGLVDAMSSFGLKGPLRKEIIANDYYWSTAHDLLEKLNKMEMLDNMIYKELSRNDIETSSPITPIQLPGI